DRVHGLGIGGHAFAVIVVVQVVGRCGAFDDVAVVGGEIHRCADREALGVGLLILPLVNGGHLGFLVGPQFQLVRDGGEILLPSGGGVGFGFGLCFVCAAGGKRKQHQCDDGRCERGSCRHGRGILPASAVRATQMLPI